MNIRYFALSLLMIGASNYAMVDTGRGALRALRAARPLVSTFARGYRIGNSCNNCVCERNISLILQAKREAGQCHDSQGQEALIQRVKDLQTDLDTRSRLYVPCLDKRTAAVAAQIEYFESARCY